jgi:molybdenum transport protein
MFFISDHELEEILSEDIPYGDETVDLMGIGDAAGRITCHPKADGVVSGVSLAARIFRMVGLTVQELARDGERIAAGTTILKASGSAGAIHATYKTAQTVMEYCSGISGRARAMVDAAASANPRCRVALTRKHFPGAKKLSLYAGLAGGATIHRMGLSESILIFDQHRVFADDFPALLARMKAVSPERKIAVEAATADEGLAFVRAGADIIQCERFSPEALAEFIGKARGENPAVLVSAAGGVNAETAAAYAAAGADFLVTTWPYFGKPFDIKMVIERN